MDEPTVRRASDFGDGPEEDPSERTSDTPYAKRSPNPVHETSEPGDYIDRLFKSKYRIVRLIGEGGFGSVYEAIDETGLGNRVAIKILKPRAQASAAEAEQYRRSLRDEARRVVCLDHPNIVDWKVFDETDAGEAFFVMEYLDGEELDQILKREKKLDPDRAATLLHQILNALRAAHHLSENESILHLDLKPKNVIVLPVSHRDGAETVKVIDFGISQYTGAGKRRPDGAASSSITIESLASQQAEESSRQGTGCTPEYASPEQCAHMLSVGARPLDARSDLYSIGVIGYQMLTGELPFERSGDSWHTVLTKLAEPARSVGSTGVKVPKHLAAFVDKCLEREPEDRWQDAGEAFDALDKIVHPPMWKNRLKAAAVVTAVLLPLAFALGSNLGGKKGEATFFLRVGQETLDVSRPLFFGPAQQEARLFVSGDEAGRPPAEGAIELRRPDDDHALAGWRADWGDAGEVVLRAEEGAKLSGFDDDAYLALEGDVFHSTPFRLVYLDPKDWSIERIDVGGVDAEALKRRVHVADQDIEVFVHGDAGRSWSATLTCGGAPVGGEPEWADAEGGRVASWSLSLLAADAREGEAFTVEFVDEADNHSSKTFAAKLTTDRLKLSPTIVDGGKRIGMRNGQPHLTRNSNASLIVELPPDRPVQVSWDVVSEDGGTERAIERLGGSEAHPGGRYEIPLPADALFDHLGQKFDGRIDIVADDRQFVRYADPAPPSDSVKFVFNPKPPEFTARLVDGGKTVDLVDMSEVHPTAYVSRGPYQLLVARTDNDYALKFWLRATVTELADPGAPVSTVNRDLLTLGVERTGEEYRIEFPRDGAYTVELDALAPDAEDSAAPETSQSYFVVVDTDSAVLRLAGVTEKTVVREMWPQTPSFVLTRDPGATDHTAPIGDLAWTLTRDDGVLGEGRLQKPLNAGAPVSFTVPELAVESVPADGAYSLTVTGTSAAHVAATPVELSWVIACAGPDIRVKTPKDGELWKRDVEDEADRWRLVMELNDPNSIELSAITIAFRADDGTSLALPEGDVDMLPLGPGRYELSAHYGFGPAWDKRRVEVVIDAVDHHGNLSNTLVRCTLPEIRPVLRNTLRFASTQASEVLSQMHLVQVQRDAQYSLGGRGDSMERQLYRDEGIDYDYNENRVHKISWNVLVDLDDTLDFYLDQREVTVAQFLDFLDWGYLDASWWERSGETPDPERARALRERLEGESPERSVAGVRWAEADAYASWVGKRLPTLFELEYAIRGGLSYRPFAADSVGVYTGAGGADVTSDTQLRNLSSDVSEWSSTPERSSSAGVKGLTSPYGGRTAKGVPEFYSVGARNDPKYFDFSLKWLDRRATERANLGFRCALSAAEVQGEQQGARTSTVTFQALDLPRAAPESTDSEDHPSRR
jgi:serine/threonine-protein kinase